MKRSLLVALLFFYNTLGSLEKYPKQEDTHPYDQFTGSLEDIDLDELYISFKVSTDLKELPNAIVALKAEESLKPFELSSLVNPKFDRDINRKLSNETINDSRKGHRKKRKLAYHFSEPIILSPTKRLVLGTTLYKSRKGEVTGGFRNSYVLHLIEKKWTLLETINYSRL